MSPSKPAAGRPAFPSGYGIHSDEDGLLPWDWAVQRLVRSRNYWIATVSETGAPHAMPVWGLWVDGGVVFSTSSHSRKGRNVRRDPRAVVHLESGDEVVVLEGEVGEIELDDGLADAYEAKYDVRPEPGSRDGLWLRLRPRVAYAWLERDYPHTATRFVFPE